MLVEDLPGVDPVLKLLDEDEDGFLEEDLVDGTDHLLGGGHHEVVDAGEESASTKFKGGFGEEAEGGYDGGGGLDVGPEHLEGEAASASLGVEGDYHVLVLFEELGEGAAECLGDNSALEAVGGDVVLNEVLLSRHKKDLLT